MELKKVILALSKAGFVFIGLSLIMLFGYLGAILDLRVQPVEVGYFFHAIAALFYFGFVLLVIYTAYNILTGIQSGGSHENKS